MPEGEQMTLIPGTPDEAKMVEGPATPQKPVFDKMTKAKIVDVSFEKEPELKKDKKNQDYQPCVLTISFQVEGIKEPVKEFYAFGVYQNKDEDGVAHLSAYYGTEKSKGGALRRLTERTFAMPSSTRLDDYMNLLKGKECVIKSEDTSFQGKGYKKIVIQQFQL